MTIRADHQTFGPWTGGVVYSRPAIDRSLWRNY